MKGKPFPPSQAQGTFPFRDSKVFVLVMRVHVISNPEGVRNLKGEISHFVRNDVKRPCADEMTPTSVTLARDSSSQGRRFWNPFRRARLRATCLTRVEPRVRSPFALQMRSLTAKRRPQHTVLMCEKCVLRPLKGGRSRRPFRGGKREATPFLSRLCRDILPPHV